MVRSRTSQYVHESISTHDDDDLCLDNDFVDLEILPNLCEF